MARPTAPYVVVGLVVMGWTPQALLRDIAVALGASATRSFQPDQPAESLTFETPDAGIVLVTCRVDEGDPRFVAVEMFVSGDLLGGPSWILLSPEEQAALERSRSFVKRALVILCGRLKPLYAGAGVEWKTAVPSALHENWLPSDVFWSGGLEAADPPLASDLGAIYGVPGHPFQGGTLIAAGGLVDIDAKPPPEPLAAGHAAARRLARALAAMFPGKQGNDRGRP